MLMAIIGPTILACGPTLLASGLLVGCFSSPVNKHTRSQTPKLYIVLMLKTDEYLILLHLPCVSVIHSKEISF